MSFGKEEHELKKEMSSIYMWGNLLVGFNINALWRILM